MPRSCGFVRIPRAPTLSAGGQAGSAGLKSELALIPFFCPHGLVAASPRAPSHPVSTRFRDVPPTTPIGERMTIPALLALADGTIFRGTAIGVEGQAVGEVVFNTAMTGYQEILTDPSYA